MVINDQHGRRPPSIAVVHIVRIVMESLTFFSMTMHSLLIRRVILSRVIVAVLSSH